MESQLLHSPSSSLHTTWESSRGYTKSLGFCTHGEDLEKAPGSQLWMDSAQPLVTI